MARLINTLMIYVTNIISDTIWFLNPKWLEGDKSIALLKIKIENFDSADFQETGSNMGSELEKDARSFFGGQHHIFLEPCIVIVIVTKSSPRLSFELLLRGPDCEDKEPEYTGCQ